jgi:hypothetical protein
MDYVALRAELTTDPAKLGYGPLLATGSANRVAALINESTQQGLGSVPITPLLEWIAAHGIMARLRAAAAGEDAAVASIAEVALMLVSNPNIPALDLSRVRVQQMLGALGAAGVIPAEAQAELMGMATTYVSRAQVLGLGAVSADDVSKAMEA